MRTIFHSTESAKASSKPDPSSPYEVSPAVAFTP